MYWNHILAMMPYTCNFDHINAQCSLADAKYDTAVLGFDRPLQNPRIYT